MLKFFVKLIVFSTLVLFCISRVPNGYSDFYARHKFWPLAKIFASCPVYGTCPDDPNAIVNVTHDQQVYDQCFNDSKFLTYVFVDCDFWGNETWMVNCSSALGVSHDEEAIILAFRWTVGWGEVYEQSDYNKTVPFPGGGTVLSFYYNAFASVWYGGIRDAFFSVRNSYPTYEVWVTGWSLGAATATMGAAYLSQMGYVQPNNIKLMNFGSPRLGHPDFANRFPSLVPYAYRVVHNRDHVPHAPTTADGYQHIKNEVWYPNAMRDGDPYIECDTGESLNCSAQIQPSQYIPGNHATYFNITGYCQRSP